MILQSSQLPYAYERLDESVKILQLIAARSKFKVNDNMATFKIDDVEYDTDKLDTTQKRVVGLYQKSLQDEGEALNNLEMARAARIELGRKLKELVIDSEKK